MNYFTRFLVESKRKQVIFGRIPSVNLPSETHKQSSPQKRLDEEPEPKRQRQTFNELQLNTGVSYFYKNFADICSRVPKLQALEQWIKEIHSDRIILKIMHEELILPKIELIVDDSLGYTILTFGWFLPEDHQLYTKYRRNIRNVNILDITNLLKEYTVCNGVKKSESTTSHSVPLVIDPFLFEEHEPFKSKTWHRHNNCEMLSYQEVCEKCLQFAAIQKRSYIKRTKILQQSIPVSSKAPLSKVSQTQMKTTVIEHRLKCKQLEDKIEEIKKSLDKQIIN